MISANQLKNAFNGQVNINPGDLQTLTCGNCSNDKFDQVFIVKKIPSVLSPTGKQILLVDIGGFYQIRIILIIFLLGLSAKHSSRIYENSKIKNLPWPSIYSDTIENKKYENTPIFKNDDLILYFPKQSMCYYSNFNPCTHLVNFEFKINDLKLEKIYGYKKYSFIQTK